MTCSSDRERNPKKTKNNGCNQNSMIKYKLLLGRENGQFVSTLSTNPEANGKGNGNVIIFDDRTVLVLVSNTNDIVFQAQFADPSKITGRVTVLAPTKAVIDEIAQRLYENDSKKFMKTCNSMVRNENYVDGTVLV